MNFEEALKILNSNKESKIKPGLERIKKILELLGNPQDKLKIVHIAGTNGKGSICTMLSYILCENGLKTGLFLSPHIMNIRERLQINNEFISEKNFTSIFEKINELSKNSSEKITYFEIITAMGFEYFSAENCDIAIIETGIGGKFDSTNVIKNPLCSVITNISLDHTKILGDSIEKITLEKCGIIKKNSPVVISSNQENIAKSKISEYCKKMNCKAIFCNSSNITNINLKNLDITKFCYKNVKYELTLRGEHQLINANTVLETIDILKKFFNLQYKKTFDGLKKSYIPARFEIFRTLNDQIIVLDGAHNPAGIIVLKKSIEQYFKNNDIVAICGMLATKDIDTCLRLILPIFTKVYTVMPNSDRAALLDEFTQIAKKFNKNTFSCKNPSSAIKTATYENPNSVIVIFGSLYLASDFHNQCFNRKTVSQYSNSWI